MTEATPAGYAGLVTVVPGFTIIVLADQATASERLSTCRKAGDDAMFLMPGGEVVHINPNTIVAVSKATFAPAP